MTTAQVKLGESALVALPPFHLLDVDVVVIVLFISILLGVGLLRRGPENIRNGRRRRPEDGRVLVF